MMEGRVEPHEVTRVGGLLRAGRGRAGLDVTEVARCLNIRPTFIRAIEENRSAQLPGTVYAIGFVRAYAELVGLDADDMVRRFRDEASGLDVRAPLRFPRPVVEATTPKGGVLLVGAVLAIVAYTTWYVSSSGAPDVAELVAPVPERFGTAGADGDRRSTPGGDGPSGITGPGSETPGGKASTPATGGPGRPAPGPASVDIASAERSESTSLSSPTDARQIPAERAPLRAAAPGSETPDSAALDPTAQTVATRAPATPDDLPIAEMTTAATPPTPRPEVEVHSPPPAPTTALAAEPPDGALASVADPAARIVLRARSDSWVEVRDVQTKSLLAARLLRPGDIYRVPDRPGLRLVTGNAGGLVVVVDGEIAPSLGGDGVVRRGVPLDAEALRRGVDAGSGQ